MYRITHIVFRHACGSLIQYAVKVSKLDLKIFNNHFEVKAQCYPSHCAIIFIQDSSVHHRRPQNLTFTGKETNEINTRSPFWDMVYWVFNSMIMDVL